MPVEIRMPSLGMYTIEGELTRWLASDGAAVEAGQPVLELTTEKANQQIDAPAAGTLRHAVAEGARVEVQGLMGYILAPGEALPAPAGSPVTNVPAAVDPEPGPTPARAPTSTDVSPTSEVRSSPLARRRAAQLGVDLSRVVGTGPGGRITEADVQAAAGSQPAASTAPGAPVAAIVPPGPIAGGPGTSPSVSPMPDTTGVRVADRRPLSGMRGLIARRMHQSLLNTAQLTLVREVDATPLLVARRAYTAASPGTPVRYDTLLARAFAAALVAFPALNAAVDGDEIVTFSEVHVGVAVTVPDGLVVPVLRNPATRAVDDLNRDLDALVDRARRSALRQEDIEGATATITNLGAQNVDFFTPILNPPQSAMLGIGRIAPRPLVGEDGDLSVRPTVFLNLTFDHRVADGAGAAALLDAVVAECAALAGAAPAPLGEQRDHHGARRSGADDDL